MKKTNISQNGSSIKDKNKKQQDEEESFKITHVFEAIASLPRVLRLVWSTHARLTAAMALVSILRGFTPAISFWITKQLIDSVVNAIKTHHVGMVLWYVGAQLLVSVLDRFLSTLSKIVQQLLQDRVSTRVQLLILEKANTLDLAYFEDSEFYDKMRRAADEATYKPVLIISQTFELVQTVIDDPATGATCMVVGFGGPGCAHPIVYCEFSLWLDRVYSHATRITGASQDVLLQQVND